VFPVADIPTLFRLCVGNKQQGAAEREKVAAERASRETFA
jgi:hypothetical protein